MPLKDCRNKDGHLIELPKTFKNVQILHKQIKDFPRAVESITVLIRIQNLVFTQDICLRTRVKTLKHV